MVDSKKIYCGAKSPPPSGRPLGSAEQCKRQHRLFGVRVLGSHAAQTLTIARVNMMANGPVYCGAKRQGKTSYGTADACKSKRQHRLYGQFSISGRNGRNNSNNSNTSTANNNNTLVNNGNNRPRNRALSYAELPADPKSLRDIRQILTDPKYLEKSDQLRVRPSKIEGAGQGLFTTEPIGKRVGIVHYFGRPLLRLRNADDNGRVLTIQEQPKWLTDAAYLKYKQPDGSVIVRSELGNSFANWASYVNDSTVGPRPTKPNCKFTKRGELMSTDKIKSNAELTVEYGTDFWSKYLIKLDAGRSRAMRKELLEHAAKATRSNKEHAASGAREYGLMTKFGPDGPKHSKVAWLVRKILTELPGKRLVRMALYHMPAGGSKNHEAPGRPVDGHWVLIAPLDMAKAAERGNVRFSNGSKLTPGFGQAVLARGDERARIPKAGNYLVMQFAPA